MLPLPDPNPDTGADSLSLETGDGILWNEDPEEASIGDGGRIFIPVGGWRWSGRLGLIVEVDEAVDAVSKMEPSLGVDWLGKEKDEGGFEFGELMATYVKNRYDNVYGSWLRCGSAGGVRVSQSQSRPGNA